MSIVRAVRLEIRNVELVEGIAVQGGRAGGLTTSFPYPNSPTTKKCVICLDMRICEDWISERVL